MQPVGQELCHRIDRRKQKHAGGHHQQALTALDAGRRRFGGMRRCNGVPFLRLRSIEGGSAGSASEIKAAPIELG